MALWAHNRDSYKIKYMLLIILYYKITIKNYTIKFDNKAHIFSNFIKKVAFITQKAMAHKSYVTYIVWFNSLHHTIPYVVFIVVYGI